MRQDVEWSCSQTVLFALSFLRSSMKARLTHFPVNYEVHTQIYADTFRTVASFKWIICLSCPPAVAALESASEQALRPSNDTPRPSTDTPPPSTDTTSTSTNTSRGNVVKIEVDCDEEDIVEVNRRGSPWIRPITWAVVGMVLCVEGLIANSIFFMAVYRTVKKPKFKAEVVLAMVIILSLVLDFTLMYRLISKYNFLRHDPHQEIVRERAQLSRIAPSLPPTGVKIYLILRKDHCLRNATKAPDDGVPQEKNRREFEGFHQTSRIVTALQ
ncbi:uncharacterized protein BDZ99DRAFT_526874 [Mytilinidion resinicola]|uniref:Uncharacterized protein n=1 Tax=Mytilinidion resinicola TaxID=574789 RepID=A0A6A6Y5R8_9PEZI|nr:uncharacterized protein BDZ99DRAFT_526874 [Mytilinidion resinicola]KAF2803127.1 hypothetical protein BDZ99DRAFT_526874 [Mytilinidion resinicola]